MLSNVFLASISTQNQFGKPVWQDQFGNMKIAAALSFVNISAGSPAVLTELLRDTPRVFWRQK